MSDIDDRPSISELLEGRERNRLSDEERIIEAAPALLAIVAAAQEFQRRWNTADFEDDAKPARLALFATLAKVRI